MASSALPDLQLGSDQLIDFLKAELATLENDLGGPDAEARGLLDMLQRQTRLIQQISGEDAAGGAAALTDLEIAQQIDSLDAQLSQLEASLSSADKPTMQLLGQSTERWLNPGHSEQQGGNTPSEEQPPAAGAAAGCSAVHSSSSSSQAEPAVSAEQHGAAGDGSEAACSGCNELEGQAAVPVAAQQVEDSTTAGDAGVAEAFARKVSDEGQRAQQQQQQQQQQQ